MRFFSPLEHEGIRSLGEKQTIGSKVSNRERRIADLEETITLQHNLAVALEVSLEAYEVSSREAQAELQAIHRLSKSA